MLEEELIGKAVEYRDKAEGLRFAEVEKVYGGKATIILKWKDHTLIHRRILLKKIIKVRVGKEWQPFVLTPKKQVISLSLD